MDINVWKDRKSFIKSTVKGKNMFLCSIYDLESEIFALKGSLLQLEDGKSARLC